MEIHKCHPAGLRQADSVSVTITLIPFVTACRNCIVEMRLFLCELLS